MRQLNIRVTKEDLRKLKELVKEGHFNSISEAVRYAVERLLKIYFSNVK